MENQKREVEVNMIILEWLFLFIIVGQLFIWIWG